MKLLNLLSVVDASQQIRVKPYGRKPIYEGAAFECPLEDRKVIAVYTMENILVLEVQL